MYQPLKNITVYCRIKLRATAGLWIVGSGVLIITSNSYAQRPARAGATKPVAVDTPMVEQLFFSALVEKTHDKSDAASDLFNRILQIDPSNDATLYELARIKKDQKNFTDAQNLLEKAVAVKPNNEWYWVALADIYEKGNDVAKLENVFTELIRLNPDKSEYYYDLANAYFIEKKYDEALKIYDRVEKFTGPTDELTINRQKVYLRQGK